MAGLLRATTGRCNGAPLTILDSSPIGPWPLAQELIAVLVSVAPTIRSPSPSPGPPSGPSPPPNMRRTQSRPSLTAMRTFPAAAAVATTSSVSAAPSTVSCSWNAVRGCWMDWGHALRQALPSGLLSRWPGELRKPVLVAKVSLPLPPLPPSSTLTASTHHRPSPLPDNPSTPIKIIDGKFNGDLMRPYLAAINPSYKDTQGR